MTRQPAIQTNDIDLAAVYMTATGLKPGMYRATGDTLVTFQMPSDKATRKVMLEYALGSLELNVKRFAACRAWLYRQTRGVRP
jgi:hypothetical protein